jgi:hypothetical protein
MGARQVADLGERVLQRLRQWGCELPPSNRLERGVALIHATNDEAYLAAANEPLLERIGEAGRAILELYMATHADPAPPPGIALEKFTQALGGQDVPRTERDHSARDTQYELYVWGQMRAARVPVWFEEPPDLMFTFGTETVGIAAKRIWSLDQAKKRLSDGVGQIERSGRRGFIATNAQEYITADSLVGELQEKGESFNADLKRLHGHLAYLATKPRVLGLMVSGTKFGWQAGSPRRLEMTSYNQVLVVTRGDDDERVGAAFFAAKETALRAWWRDNM